MSYHTLKNEVTSSNSLIIYIIVCVCVCVKRIWLYITQKSWYAIKINHHHHHVVPQARISQTLSRHFSLSSIASGRSSELHHGSSHSCLVYVRAGRPAFSRPYVGVHRSTSLMSSSLLLRQCPACLVRLTWIVFVMGGRWTYNSCLVGVLAPGHIQITKQNQAFKSHFYFVKVLFIQYAVNNF